MKLGTEKHHIDGVFVLLLTVVFAACILLVLFTGAGTYRSITQRGDEDYARRVCVQYVAAKVRHADGSGNVFVGDFSGKRASGGDTLFLAEQHSGKTYYTRVYYWDGYVRELFTEAGGTFAKNDGAPVLAAKSLRFSYDTGTGLLDVRTEDTAGNPSALTLSLRSGEGEQP